MRKVKSVNFSETFAGGDMKVVRCRQLIELMKVLSIEGQGHFFTINFQCFVLYKAKKSGERLQDHWSSGYLSVEGISQNRHDSNTPLCLR